MKLWTMINTNNKNLPNQFKEIGVEIDGTLKRGGFPIEALKISNNFSASEVEVEFLKGQRFNRRAFSTLVTGSVYTVSVTDYLIGITSLSYAPSVGLPSPKNVGVGKNFIVKDEAGGAGTTTITIRSAGEETIDGAATSTITINYGTRNLYNDGANWFTYPLLTEGSGELATAAETTTGTDATKAITPDGLAGSDYGKRVVGIQVVDAGTDMTTGDGKAFFRIPSVMNGWNLVAVAAKVYTAGTTSTCTIQIRNITQAADMLSTKISIDSAELDSSTAATPAVIDTANDDVATGDGIAIDVDTIHTTAAKGLFVELIFQLP